MVEMGGRTALGWDGQDARRHRCGFWFSWDYVREKFLEEAIDVDIALSAFAGGEIEFQVGIGACCIADVVECGSRQRGASEIRVQNNARGIDKRLQRVSQGFA